MAAEPELPTGSPRRIFITGAVGSGKSTLARRLGERLALPVHDLDLIYREGGGDGPVRPVAVRDAELHEIAQQPDWVVAGIQLDGTAELLARAELIVWLDHLVWWRARGRVARRFISGAWAEVRQRRGRERFLRCRDYGRRLRELGGALTKSRDHAAEGSGAAPMTRAAVAGRLGDHAAKVVRITSSAQLEQLVRRLRPATAKPG